MLSFNDFNVQYYNFSFFLIFVKTCIDGRNIMDLCCYEVELRYWIKGLASSASSLKVIVAQLSY